MVSGLSKELSLSVLEYTPVCELRRNPTLKHKATITATAIPVVNNIINVTAAVVFCAA